MRQKESNLLYRGVYPNIYEVFAILKLNQKFWIVNDLDKALAAVEGKE